MNILTFDIEEWYIEKQFGADRKTKYDEYDRILQIILETLASRSIKATFFILGKIAEEFPHVVKKIASFGHEIGCHSHVHTWINKMTQEEFRDDTKKAVYSLEDLIGEKVVSYRAPAFSICESNKWAFEILSEFGIENDASVFPGARDFGGFPSFTEKRPVNIVYNDISINEFPIPLTKLPFTNKELAYSGGGYFRLLPFGVVKKMISNSDYNMFYFHIGDLESDKLPLMSKEAYEKYFKVEGTLKNRMVRYFKSNVGRKKCLPNLISLINAYDFISINEFTTLNSLRNPLPSISLK